MRWIILLLLGVLSTSALAGKSQPENLQPLPQSGEAADEANDAPDITISKKTSQTVEEYRVGGHLYMIKITPKNAPAYYLIDEVGNGKFTRQGTLDAGFRAPQWVIKKF